VASWPVQDAKARFSELLEKAAREGPQTVTKRGIETAVLVPIDEWRRLQSQSRPTLKDWLLAEPRFAGFDKFLPDRRGLKIKPRPVEFE
jgi:antitoxin Phd